MSSIVECTSRNPLDYFGTFLVQTILDQGVRLSDLALRGHWKDQEMRRLQKRLVRLSRDQKQSVRRLIQRVLVSVMHDFLFTLQASADFEKRMKVLVDRKDVVPLSDGIHGELFGSKGWIKKHSRFRSRFRGAQWRF